MPTGYTAPILDGKITNFKDYAKLCMRAFGATIHMKEESLDVEYEERKPSEYHIKALKEWQEKLTELSNMSDEELLEKRRSEIMSDIEYHEKQIIKHDNNYSKLMSILNDVQSWEPPTEEHTGIKKFMTEQITETLKYDADSKYHKLEIKERQKKLKELTIEEVKKGYIKDANYNIQYHIKHNEDDIKRANDSNEWVNKFLNSL